MSFIKLFFEATGHLVKACLGGGILGIHEAFMKCGLWTSLGLTIFLGFYLAYCEYLLVSSAQTLCTRLNLSQLSYPDVAETVLDVQKDGRFQYVWKYRRLFRYLVDTIICIDLFGACCVYQIIIAKSIHQVIEIEDEGLIGYMPLRLYIMVLLIPLLLLGMITTLKYLAPFSIVANCFIGVCVIATIVYGQKVAPPLSSVPGWKNVIGLIEYSSVAVFSMEGVGCVLPIENNMKDPTQFPKVLCVGTTIVVSFVITTGFFGYWGFGENCQSPVTLNFPDDIFPTILKCLVAFMIYVTFALNFWAPFNLIWHYVKRKHKPETFWLWERVYRAIIIIIITVVAVAFPNIGNLMGLLGAFSVSNLAFIFPSIINTLVFWDNPGMGKYKWRLWKNVFILVFGLFLLCTGTVANIRGLIKNL